MPRATLRIAPSAVSARARLRRGASELRRWGQLLSEALLAEGSDPDKSCLVNGKFQVIKWPYTYLHILKMYEW